MKKTVWQLMKHVRSCFVCAVALMSFGSWGTWAQDRHAHDRGDEQELTAEQLSQRSELIRQVRQHTARFQDFHEAIRENYFLGFGCVSGSDQGAMGLHFINMEIVKSGVIDVTQPQIILYEPMPDGSLKLTGADFLVDAAQWDSDKTHGPGPPN